MAKKEYYTSQEARQRLGVSKTTFYEYVKAGHIYKLPPQKQRGAFYLAKDVDELAAARKGFAKSDDIDKEKTIFRRARPEDAQQMHELGESIMRKSGEHSAPTKMLLHFLSMPNSEIGHVLVRDEQVIGYFTLVPLTHDQILHVMRRDQQSLFHSSHTQRRRHSGYLCNCYNTRRKNALPTNRNADHGGSSRDYTARLDTFRVEDTGEKNLAH